MHLSSLADLKRHMATRPSLTLTAFLFNGKPASHKYLGTTRAVVLCRSKDFALGTGPENEPSCMNWPKANEVTFHDEMIGTPATLQTIGFAIACADGPTLVYRFA